MQTRTCPQLISWNRMSFSVAVILLFIIWRKWGVVFWHQDTKMQAIAQHFTTFYSTGSLEDGLSGPGGTSCVGLCVADHSCGDSWPLERAGRKAGENVQAADGRLWGSASRQEWSGGQRGETAGQQWVWLEKVFVEFDHVNVPVVGDG